MTKYIGMESIVHEMRAMYMQDDAEWIVMTSLGKDSTYQLACVWKMLLSLTPECRRKKVHVVTGNTLVETPIMMEYSYRILKMISEAAVEQHLPFEVHIATPEMKDRFFYQVLGKGNPPPSERSRFRWCTEKMKIKPAEKLLQSLLVKQTPEFGRSYDVVMLLGVRLDESVARANSIRKHQEEEDSKLSRHSTHSNILVYHPIKHVSTQTLWNDLLKLRVMPWGSRASELYAMYKDSTGECPLTNEGLPSKSCGGGRMGCFTCTVAGRKDKMLAHLMDSGHADISYLMEWKQILYDVRSDIRYREPLRRVGYKRSNIKLQEQEGITLLDSLEDGEYHKFDRASDWTFIPGPITIEGRRLLLQKLLYVQQATGNRLIEDEEINAIINCWREDGYFATERDIVPLDWQYDGSLILLPNATKNTKESTNPNPVFAIWREFLFGQAEIIEMLRKKANATGKQFFYFMRFIDFRDHFQVNDDMVYNTVQFIVCQSDVSTTKEAEQVIDAWLDDTPRKELFD